ncbi:hypothetical protein TGVAND_359810 [Toxoplasma gondii VAND]|uniref:Uncharacterized protein n=2 Tax=Toxoplasma gondii TaxID=5811 RepID=A0A086JKW1_TOXGO|nr:hypothetical protein TGP89_359810 [Toxoplasma gondii p89]KFH01463.1 hypothetical protein TGVAND_359810 [Toxoplasma gondii VAND]
MARCLRRFWVALSRHGTRKRCFLPCRESGKERTGGLQTSTVGEQGRRKTHVRGSPGEEAKSDLQGADRRRICEEGKNANCDLRGTDGNCESKRRARSAQTVRGPETSKKGGRNGRAFESASHAGASFPEGEVPGNMHGRKARTPAWTLLKTHCISEVYREASSVTL